MSGDGMEDDWLYDGRTLTPEQEKKKYDYIRNIYNASTRNSNKGDLGMRSRQEKALEIRDLITKINAISAELQEDGFTVEFHGVRTIRNRITEVSVERKQFL